MEHGIIYIVLAALAASFMAFNNGGNDIANAFASVVGSKALKMRTAIFIGSLVTFAGALILGGNVAVKLVSGLIPPTTFNNPQEYIIAMISVLMASGVFVFISTLTSLPVSSSHAIVGSLTGISIFIAGWETVQWDVLGMIALAWVLSPLIAAVLSLSLSRFIEGFVIGSGPGTIKRVRFWLPIVVAVTIVGGIYALFTLTSLKNSIGIDADKLFASKSAVERRDRQTDRADRIAYGTQHIQILMDKMDCALQEEETPVNSEKLSLMADDIERTARKMSMTAKNLSSEFSGYAPAIFYLKRWHILSICLLLLVPIYFQCRAFIHRWLKACDDTPHGVQNAFKNLQIGSSCYVAFAIGSNDVANSISPVLAICMVVEANGIPESFDTAMPLWILILGGLAMAAGISVLGHRVMKTLGEKITTISNASGFCVDFSVATTVVGASALGLPISTTHAATGAITGAGLSKGARNVHLAVLSKIILGWLITIPASVVLTIGIFRAMLFFFSVS